MDKTSKRRASLLAALAAVAPLVLGACGSNSSSSDAPSSGQDGGSSTQQAGIAQFAQCMRQNGVKNFPDPSSGHFVMGGSIQSNPHFQTAIQTCQHFLGPGGIGGGQTGAQQSARLAFAHCMQTHGVPKFPDPAPGGAIVAPSGVDRNSAAYQNAFSTCKSKLPNGGAGLGG